MDTSRNLVMETDIALENGSVITAIEGRDYRKVIDFEAYRRRKKRNETIEDVKLVGGIIAISILCIAAIFLL